jgi:hypothetical protein
VNGHAAAAYLRVFQPLAAYSPGERSAWAAYVDAGQALPASVLVVQEERRGLARALGLAIGADPEHALVLQDAETGTVFVCPLRSELRRLQSMVAFSTSLDALPHEVRDAFLSPDDLARAERELERLHGEAPEARSQMLQAVWHVPLHWFVLFSAEERQLHPAEGGRPPSLTYQTTMASARTRVSRALGILRDLMQDADVVAAVEELREWLYAFDPDSLVQLDYAGLTVVIAYPDLAADVSAGETWEALEALEEGDLERSSELYRLLTERWSVVRGREASN